MVGIEHYAGTPSLGERALEIQFIEVKDEQSRLGIGTEVVESLIALHPNRRMVAFSEGADGFWSSLGWKRHEHATEPQFYRPLFIQPGD
jgi:hypothetical protein